MAKSESTIINGRKISKSEIIKTGEKRIEKGRKTRKVFSIVLIVFGAMVVVGGPVAKIQGSITNIGEMIGAIAGGLVIAALGVLLFFKSKAYPSKKDPYEVGHKYLSKHIVSPENNVVSRELVDTKNVFKNGRTWVVEIYEITYEDGHVKKDVVERPA